MDTTVPSDGPRRTFGSPVASWNGHHLLKRDRRTTGRGVRLARPARGVSPAISAVVADAAGFGSRFAQGWARHPRAAGWPALGRRASGRLLRAPRAFR